jgi:hypothetical protein
MALQNDTSRIQYNGNNSTTSSYAIPFVFFENAHIKCVVTNSAGVDTTLALGSGFNVTGAANPNGGSLTTTTAVPTSSKVTIFREVPATQTTSYQEGGDFPAASHERALDKLTMIAQQTKRLADRALKVPETQNNPNDIPNAGSGKKLLGIDNGSITWEDNRQLPQYPATAGTNALVTAGGGTAPSWQTIPAIATGPITATGSTTPRFLSDRFGEVFHVNDFGAKGDWNGTSGTDDRNAIQAAINAAIAAGGGTIRFSPSKTYYVNGRTQNPIGQTSGSHHLGIFNATVSTKIRIEGNGATLYSNRYTAATPDWTDFFYICSRFDTIDIDGLTFQRAPHVITTTGSPTCGIRMNFFDSNISNLLRFNNCVFVDCRTPIVINNYADIYECLNKLLLVDISECQFLNFRGSSVTSTAGGGQTINLSRWVKTARFHNCYFDGCVGGVLPADVRWPVDGFTYLGASNNIYSNCFFTNNWVETILPAQAAEATVGVRINGLDANSNIITQPAIGGFITVKVDASDISGTVKVGNNYIFMGPGGTSSVSGGLPHTYFGPYGSYKLTGFTGAYAGHPAGTLTFERINTLNLGVDPKAKDVPTGETFTAQPFIQLIDPEISKLATANINNCVFYYPNKVRTENKAITGNASSNMFTCNNHLFTDGFAVKFFNLVGGSGLSNDTTYFLRDITQNTFRVSQVNGGPAIDFASNVTAGEVVQYFPMGQPAIFAGRGTGTTVSNCVFVGAVNGVAVTDQFHWGPSQPVSISNNYFYIHHMDSTVPLQNASASFISTDNCSFVGNVITIERSGDIAWVLFIGANGTIVSNNTVKVREEANVPTATRFINWNNGAPTGGWKCVVENNHITGLDSYANIVTTTQIMGPFMGSLRGNIAVAGSQEIKIASRLVSPDKSEWLVRITNNGELEVSK